MSEERPSQHHSSWLERLAQVFSGEPQNQEQLITLLREAQNRQILDGDCLSIIEGAMQVAEMQVREIMVPRAQMVALKSSSVAKDILPLVIESTHSRFPVMGETPDDVLGILLAKDLLQLALNGQHDKFNLKDMLRPATFVPESKRVNMLLKEFRSTRNHMAIVVDEYGGVAGIVTIEDVLEQIVGDIEDEHDVNDEESYIRPANGSDFIVKALTPIEEFNAFFSTGFSDDEFDTIGGILTQQFGHLPKRDESIVVDNLQFKILNADNRRVHLFQVTTTPKTPA